MCPTPSSLPTRHTHIRSTFLWLSRSFCLYFAILHYVPQAARAAAASAMHAQPKVALVWKLAQVVCECGGGGFRGRSWIGAMHCALCSTRRHLINDSELTLAALQLQSCLRLWLSLINWLCQLNMWARLSVCVCVCKILNWLSTCLSGSSISREKKNIIKFFTPILVSYTI